MKNVNYDEVSKTYDRRYQNGIVGGIDRAIRDLIPIIPVKSVLEVGCGTGAFLELFDSEVSSYGLDFSTGMLLKAKDRKIALFVTHATPPGAPFLEPLLDKCKACADDADMIGCYDCQGVLAQELADRLLKMDDPQLQEFGKRRHVTVGHPNEEEVEKTRNNNSNRNIFFNLLSLLEDNEKELNQIN